MISSLKNSIALLFEITINGTSKALKYQSKTIDISNKNNESMTYASSLPQPFENEPTMTASEKTTKVSAPDLVLAKTTTTSSKSRITTTD